MLYLEICKLMAKTKKCNIKKRTWTLRDGPLEGEDGALGDGPFFGPKLNTPDCSCWSASSPWNQMVSF